MTVTVLPEVVVPGRRLGRHLDHDPLSRGYEAVIARRRLVSRRWANRSGVLDQGDLGSCVGNTFAAWLAHDNALRQGRPDVTEQLAVQVYERATHRDRIKGVYPPEDTGSTGLGGAKALIDLSLAKGPYRHTFSLGGALLALSGTGPLCVGIDWPEGMDEPDKAGQVRWAGKVRGGHEQLWDEVDVERSRVWFVNSWGPSYGLDGRAWLSFEDFGKALAARGDVVVLTT